jgi:large repetitive protein
MSRLSLFVVLAGLVAATACSGVWAASIFTGVTWLPVTTGGGASYYVDPLGDIAPQFVDIVGDATIPAVYWGININSTPADITDDYLLFRMRLEAPVAAQDNYCYQVLFDTDNGGDVDWVLQLDNKVDNRVEFAVADPGGPTWGDVAISTLAAQIPWTGVFTIYSETVYPTGDGSNFGGDADRFLDLGMPWVSFLNAVYGGQSTPFSVAFSTSANHNNINKDLPNQATASDPVNVGFSDNINDNNVPEPTTWALMGIGTLALFRRRRRNG